MKTIEELIEATKQIVAATEALHKDLLLISEAKENSLPPDAEYDDAETWEASWYEEQADEAQRTLWSLEALMKGFEVIKNEEWG